MLLALALIPPWQQPDEHRHVALAELHRTRIALLDVSSDPAWEGEILRSMARYDWWEHRVRRGEAPFIIPNNFDSAGPHVGGSDSGVSRPPIYFVIFSRLLSWLPRLPVVEDLYILRAISAVFGMLTLWVAWLGARECLGTLGGTTVAVLLALHPQFAIVSTAAAADGMVNLFGACMWWQTTLVIRRTQFLLPLAGVWCAAIAASAADRMGVPLLLVAFVVSVAVVRLKRPPLARRAIFTVLATAAFAVVLLGGAIWTLETFGETFGLRSSFSQSWLLVPEAKTWDFFTRFTSFVHQSWWFSLGWVRYAPPTWWIAIVVALTAIAAVGIGQRLFRDREPDAQTRMLVALAVIALVVQASAVYWTYFRLGGGAQGKSLFPVLVPCLVLLWAGIETWVPPSRRVHAAAALVALLALLDAAAWTLVAIPAYYASL
jgi:uncharacterized membrane protein YfcA